MAVVIESVSTQAYANLGSSDSMTITKPTGLLEGELMVAHLSQAIAGGDTCANWLTPSGWTQIQVDEEGGNGNSSVGIQAFYKVATSGDAAASNFSFTVNGQTCAGAGAIYRISGATTIIDSNVAGVNTDSTPSFANTVTPSNVDSLLLFLVSNADAAQTTGSVTGYAVATDDPTWTEEYELICNLTSPNNRGIMSGASATRSEVTATGNSSCTFTNYSQNESCIMVAISPEVSAEVTLDTPNIQLAPQAFTVTGKATVTLDTPNIELAPQAPTVTTPESKWKNKDKSATSSFTNTPKS